MLKKIEMIFLVIIRAYRAVSAALQALTVTIKEIAMATANGTRCKALTQERLKELLHYDSETGFFIRKEFRGGERPGNIAGTVRPNGYILINIDYGLHYAHRLAFLWMLGRFPEEVDHIDGNRSHNMWVNLREADRNINCENIRRHRSHSSSKILGVFPYGGKWLSKIVVRGKQIRIGVFDSKDEAGAAYLEAKRRLHQGCTI